MVVPVVYTVTPEVFGFFARVRSFVTRRKAIPALAAERPAVPHPAPLPGASPAHTTAPEA
jgi:hypothetical protein